MISRASLARLWQRVGVLEDLPGVAAVIVGSLALAGLLYLFHPLSPPLEVYGLRMAGLAPRTARHFTYLSAQEAYHMLVRERGAVLIDVRSSADYLRMRAAQAVSVPWSEYDRKQVELLRTVPTDRAVVLYGQDVDSPAALQMALRLTALGYRHLYVIHGGFESWKRDDSLPVRRGSQGQGR